jgi:hypothetical protein
MGVWGDQMPGAGTHTTIIQRLALAVNDNNDVPAMQFLTDPNLNGKWATYDCQDALQSRYAVLGAMGPDIFYLMLDYGAPQQEFEDVVLKIAGTFRCVGELSSQINNLVNSSLDTLTLGIWSGIQEVFSNLKGILGDGILDLLTDQRNFWYFFMPLRQVDDYEKNWYWADFLHYVKTGCFAQKLLDNAAAQQAADPGSNTANCLGAYALGYLTHYVADTVGHAYVNRIVESPWRNMWQRHHLVENFIDADVWATWHCEGTQPQLPADEQNLDTVMSQCGDPMRQDAASLNYARLNDLCNIGSAGLDPIIDNAITQICAQIQQGLFDIGVSSRVSLPAPDDPVFTTWTEFIADTMWQVYPPGQSHPTRMGRYPTSDDVAGAYGAYRLVLSLATEDEVDQPVPPNIAGDLGSILQQMWQDITNDLSSIPPPPVPSSLQGISLQALWDAIKSALNWLSQVAQAALDALGDLIAGLIEAGVEAGADTIKAGLYLINTILYSMYYTLRMTLVMSAYSSPLTSDLTATWGPLDLQTLWTAGNEALNPRYPIEPVVSQRDFASDSANPFSPYKPYYRPSGMAPVHVENPNIIFPEQLLRWATPADMLDSPLDATADMFSAAGPARATTARLPNPDGSTLTNLETFDGSGRYFGSVMVNCERALQFAVPYLTGTAYPQDVVLPDYNLDSDRGYAWPCWDVDWSYQNPATPFPWNGCDPYPQDTLNRVLSNAIPTPIDWGAGAPKSRPAPPGGVRPGQTVNDPWGSPRSGDAWVNAKALGTPGDCQYGSFPFPSIVVNPNHGDLINYDHCTAQPGQDTSVPGGGLLGPDYLFASEPRFLYSNPAVSGAPTDDMVDIYLQFPYSGPTTAENDGRLSDFLRAIALQAIHNPGLVLATAVSLWLGGGSEIPWGDGTIVTPPNEGGDHDLATAVAQLAVTGRRALFVFEAWTPTDADLVSAYSGIFEDSPFTAAEISDAAGHVLDAAYTALWAIRSNDPAWRNQRVNMRWIAVSGFDDTPHRPVNVPTSPYPQFDVTFDVQANTGPQQMTTRYMVASAGAWVGPWQDSKTSYTNPEPDLLGAPPATLPEGPVPRSIPQDAPSIPADNQIIIYIHGGGSRAEEAVDMANWFIVEGSKAGQNYTVISFDLPNSAYGARFPIPKITGGPYVYGPGHVLNFEVQYIMAFIESLDQAIGNVTGRIAAVMGGSLGGNTSLLLTGYYNKPNSSNTSNREYLRTIVSWSVTAMAPSTYLGFIAAGDIPAYLEGQQGQINEAEPYDNHAIEVQYIQNMYVNPLSGSKLLYIPPQPVMWYRGGYAPDGSLGWQPCKDQAIAESRFDRYEVYSRCERPWMTAVDLEQISISFQDTPPAPAAGTNLMLVTGDNDNYFPNAIYNSTIAVARTIRLSAPGKAEFWLDTGHSIHNERPHLFAKEILYFLANLDAGDSPNGVVVTTPPQAVYSMVTQ